MESPSRRVEVIITVKEEVSMGGELLFKNGRFNGRFKKHMFDVVMVRSPQTFGHTVYIVKAYQVSD